MEPTFNPLEFDPIITAEMQITDITRGGEKQGYLLRYRGQLRDSDTAAAYDRLDTALEPYVLQPLFRWEDEQHVVLLVKRQPKVQAGRPWVNLVLFFLTVISVFIAGVLSYASEPTAEGFAAQAGELLAAAGPYTLAILAILCAHEFGHYFAARSHRVNVSLPYLIPLPILSPFGTMGAFISMKEQPKNRRHLLGVGLAGPLAGIVVTIPILLYGLMLSPVGPLPSAPEQEDPIAFLSGNPIVYFVADLFVPGESAAEEPVRMIMEGNSILYLGLKYIVHGLMLPAPESYGTTPPWLYWIIYYFTGRPLPYGGMDVQLHSLAWAGWFGLLITGLNLIPAGQLDGGHTIYVLLGRERARKVAQIAFYVALVMGILSINWWLWAALIRVFGRFYAEPRDEITPLEPKHKALAYLGIAVFILVFIPVPLTGF